MRRGLIVLLAFAAAAGVFGTFALIETSMAGAFRATTLAPVAETTTASTPITLTTTTSSSKTTLTTTTSSSKTTLTTTTSSSKATPSISTSQEPPSATVGSSIADKATVTGLVSSSGAGTVTFNLYSSATVQNASTLLFTNTQTISLSGSTGTATSADYTTTATGTVYWVATYNGNSNNNSVSSSDSGEPVTITKASTRLTASPQFDLRTGIDIDDAVSATLSAGRKPLANEPVSFYAFGFKICNATTNQNGVATCQLNQAQEFFVEVANGYSASFAGNTDYLPSSGSTPAVIL